jgi:S-adenosylmethionine:tRNA ribosyltransferase-isomerase
MDKIRQKGIQIIPVTLHVGLGTFRPVTEEDASKHEMHSEYYEISEESARMLNEAKKAGKRIVAVGTTSVRTLESAIHEDGLFYPECKDTDIFIYPGFKFKAIDALITNFHLPKSTLVMLVSALAGRENILNAYKTAVEEKYRFFSFGDSMFIIDK